MTVLLVQYFLTFNFVDSSTHEKHFAVLNSICFVYQKFIAVIIFQGQVCCLYSLKLFSCVLLFYSFAHIPSNYISPRVCCARPCSLRPSVELSVAEGATHRWQPAASERVSERARINVISLIIIARANSFGDWGRVVRGLFARGSHISAAACDWLSVYVFHTHTEMLINLCGCNYHSNPDERPERDLPVKGNQHCAARHPHNCWNVSACERTSLLRGVWQLPQNFQTG